MPRVERRCQHLCTGHLRRQQRLHCLWYANVQVCLCDLWSMLVHKCPYRHELHHFHRRRWGLQCQFRVHDCCYLLLCAGLQASVVRLDGWQLLVYQRPGDRQGYVCAQRQRSGTVRQWGLCCLHLPRTPLQHCGFDNLGSLRLCCHSRCLLCPAQWERSCRNVLGRAVRARDVYSGTVQGGDCSFWRKLHIQRESCRHSLCTGRRHNHGGRVRRQQQMRCLCSVLCPDLQTRDPGLCPGQLQVRTHSSCRRETLSAEHLGCHWHVLQRSL